MFADELEQEDRRIQGYRHLAARKLAPPHLKADIPPDPLKDGWADERGYAHFPDESDLRKERNRMCKVRAARRRAA